MTSVVDWLLVGGGAFAAATIAAVTGFGGAAILLPILTAVFGMRDAIPILTVMQLIGNASRVWFNRREVAWPVVGWFSLGGIPAGILGGILFAQAPLAVLLRLLGIFLLVVVAYRRLVRERVWAFPQRWFAVVGAVATFLSALLGSVGPLMAPFFLAYGLVKGAYIGTEALATVVMHASKVGAYGGTAVLTLEDLWIGLALGPVMIFGSYVGKRIVDRIPERIFVAIVEITLVVAGLKFLILG
jgi:uncharacterized membrane protein YfcA